METVFAFIGAVTAVGAATGVILYLLGVIDVDVTLNRDDRDEE